MDLNKTDSDTGAQRLNVDVLERWQSEGYGMFIHFGMSTYDGDEFSPGTLDASAFNPDALDVDQWVSAAAKAGMRYAVLTAKHTSGFCLWPSKHTDYHVGNSPVQLDLVQVFIESCRRHSVKPGLYYCLWDNHHRFGSVTPSDVMTWKNIKVKSSDNSTNPMDVLTESFTTDAANAFFLAQVEELIQGYGELFEVWIDIPGIVGRAFRQRLYEKIATLQPQAVIMMNNGFGDGTNYPVYYAWPSDIMAIERWLPNSANRFDPWRTIEGRKYFLPAEVCDPIGREWFYCEDDPPRSDEELLGMYLVCRSRNTNLLLNVPPNKHGVISDDYVNALLRLRANIEKLGFSR